MKLRILIDARNFAFFNLTNLTNVSLETTQTWKPFRDLTLRYLEPVAGKLSFSYLAFFYHPLTFIMPFEAAHLVIIIRIMTSTANVNVTHVIH